MLVYRTNIIHMEVWSINTREMAMVLNMINRAGWPRWSSWFCVEFLTTLSGTFYTLLLRDELMEVEIRLAKGEYFQTHLLCAPDLRRLTLSRF